MLCWLWVMSAFKWFPKHTRSPLAFCFLKRALTIHFYVSTLTFRWQPRLNFPVNMHLRAATPCCGISRSKITKTSANVVPIRAHVQVPAVSGRVHWTRSCPIWWPLTSLLLIYRCVAVWEFVCACVIWFISVLVLTDLLFVISWKVLVSFWVAEFY